MIVTEPFTAGVLQVEWVDGEPWYVQRNGPNEMGSLPVYPAQIVSISTLSGKLNTDVLRAALTNLIVMGPKGLARIKNVETFACQSLSTGPSGRIGLMLEAM